MYEVDFIDLAKMARQYLGRPASSAGVERLFSKAGKLYGDDKKAQDYTSLEHPTPALRPLGGRYVTEHT